MLCNHSQVECNWYGADCLVTVANGTLGLGLDRSAPTMRDLIEMKQLILVAGDLQILRTYADTISFPALVTVGGALVLKSNDMDTLSVPALQSIGGELDIYFSDHLAALQFPALKEFGTHVDIQQNPALASLSAPSLRSLVGSFFLQSNSNLSTLQLPALVQIASVFQLSTLPMLWSFTLESLEATTADIIFERCTGILSISLPMLQTARSIKVQYAPKLAQFDAPKLQSMGSLRMWNTRLTALALDTTLSGVDLSHMDLLTAVSFPNVQACGISMDSCANLTVISFPRLQNLENLDIKSVPLLTAVSFRLVAQQTNSITIRSCATLSSIEFPLLEYATNLNVQQNPKLRSVSFPSLSRFGADKNYLDISYNALLSAITFPKLEAIFCGARFLSNDKLCEISFPVLITLCTNNTSTIPNSRPDYLLCNSNPSLHTASFPQLEPAEKVGIRVDIGMSAPSTNNSVVLPKLCDAGAVSIDATALGTVHICPFKVWFSGAPSIVGRVVCDSTTTVLTEVEPTTKSADPFSSTLSTSVSSSSSSSHSPSTSFGITDPFSSTLSTSVSSSSSSSHSPSTSFGTTDPFSSTLSTSVSSSSSSSHSPSTSFSITTAVASTLPSSDWILISVAAGVAVVLAIVVALFVRWRKRRAAAQAADVLLEGGGVEGNDFKDEL